MKIEKTTAHNVKRPKFDMRIVFAAKLFVFRGLVSQNHFTQTTTLRRRRLFGWKPHLNDDETMDINGVVYIYLFVFTLISLDLLTV